MRWSRWMRSRPWLPLALFGISVGCGGASPPNLSMAGASRTLPRSERSGPVSLSTPAISSMREEDIRAEVIRRLEARIQARRKQRKKEAAASRPPPSPAEEGPRLEVLQRKVGEAIQRARESAAAPVVQPRSALDTPPGADYPPEKAPLEGPGGSSLQGFVSPRRVEEGADWAPPASLPGREEGLLPPEVTGARAGITPPPPAPAAIPVPREPARVAASTPASAPDSQPSPLRPGEHRLVRGETLWAISKRYGVTVQDLILANGIANVDDLSVGTVLRIPRPAGAPPVAVASGVRPGVAPSGKASAPATGPGNYTVVRGDTLFKIARSHQVTVDELLRVNPRISAQHLSPGDVLNLPAIGGRPAQGSSSRASATGRPRPAPAVASAAPVAAKPRAGSNLSLAWPISGTVTAGFGWKNGKPHTGIDIGAPLGSVVRAAAPGKVIFAGKMKRYGNVVILDHLNGFFTVYGHVRKALVSKGSRSAPTSVRSGQAIAEVGATGEAVGPQLHFEVRKLNQAVDPMRYLGAHVGSTAAAHRGR